MKKLDRGSILHYFTQSTPFKPPSQSLLYYNFDLTFLPHFTTIPKDDEKERKEARTAPKYLHSRTQSQSPKVLPDGSNTIRNRLIVGWLPRPHTGEVAKCRPMDEIKATRKHRDQNPRTTPVGI